MTSNEDGNETDSSPRYGAGTQATRYSIISSNRSDVATSSRKMAHERNPIIPTHPLWDAKISIAVDPVALITTECITVTSAMRKHARWAHSSVSAILGGGPSIARDISRLQKPGDKTSPAGQRSGRVVDGALGDDDTLASRWGLRGKKGKSMQDNPLLSAFARLRNDLRGCTGRQCIKDSPERRLILPRHQKL